MLTTFVHHHFWKTWGLLIARLLMGGLFLFAAYNKFTGMEMTAMYITSVGIPYGLFLAWCATIFEVGLGLALITGVFFQEAALLAGVYALFLGFMFHGPSHWAGNPAEFGFFVDHFTMFAGLLYMVGAGVGHAWTIKK
jgi:putative oxidoreductase